MTERLDRIEAILENTATRQAKNTDDIDTLLGAIATTEAAVQKLTTRAEANDTRFEVLRAEANADRQETRRLFNDAVNQMEMNRDKSDKRFDEALDRIDAQQEVIQRLLIELLSTNRDATKLRDRVDGLEQKAS